MQYVRLLLPDGFHYGDTGQRIDSTDKLEVINKFSLHSSTTKKVTFKIYSLILGFKSRSYGSTKKKTCS